MPAEPVTTHEFSPPMAAPTAVVVPLLTGRGNAGTPPPDGTDPGGPAADPGGMRLVHAGHGEVVKGSSWFIGAVAVTAVGGFGYWSLAAHIASQETVGLASALFAALLFVNYVTTMGLPIAVARFCPSSARAVNRLFNYALVFTAVTSAVGALAFLAAIRNPDLFKAEARHALFGSGALLGGTLFVMLVIGQSLAVLIEVRLVTLRMWRWVLIRVIAVAVLRVPLLGIEGISKNPLGLLLVMAGLPAMSGLVGVIVLRRATPRADRGGFRPVPEEVPQALRFTLVNYLGLLAAQAPQFVLPLVVIRHVQPRENASFYLAWTVTTVVFLVPYTIGQVVLAEGSRDEDRMAHATRVRQQVRSGLALAVGVMAALAVGAVLFATPGTKIAFGDNYQATATLLPRLVLAGVPWGITSICLAYARVRQRSVATVAITLSFALGTIIPCASLVTMRGIDGAADGWLIGNVFAAVMAVVISFTVTRGPMGHLVASPTPSTGTAGI